MRSNFRHILAILHGDASCNEATDGLLSAKFDKIHETLSRVLSARSDASDTLVQRVNRASPAVRLRLLACPELWATVSSAEPVVLAPGTQDYKNLLDCLSSIVSKHFIAEGVGNEADTRAVLSNKSKSFFSPFGDAYLSYSRKKQWTRVPAWTIGDTVSLDFDSDLALQDDPSSIVFSLPRLKWLEAEREIVKEKLRRAISYIDAAAPELGLVISNFVRRIFIRKSVALGENGETLDGVVITSEYLPRYPGTIGISNPHLSENSIVTLMETILHESVHNLMECYETKYGNFMPDDTSYRPVSPWSGNLIPNHALAHATFVFYACHRLLARCLARSVFASQAEMHEAELRISEIAAGFAIGKDLPELFLVRDLPDTGLYEAMRSMQRSITDTLVHSRSGA